MDESQMILNEAEINKFLQITRRAVDKLESQGRHELAQAILGYSSNQALLSLDLLGIKSHRVYCPSCGKQAKTGADVEAVDFIGECLSCDHLREVGITYDN